jgi:hypothetical protein
MKIKKIILKDIIIDQNEKRYIPIKKSNIPILDFLICGIPMRGFGKEKTRYVSIDEELKWLRKNKEFFTSETIKKLFDENIKFYEKANTNEINPDGKISTK